MSMVSTKGSYGLTAMVVLAKENEGSLLQIKDIATKGEIPQNYLEQILVILKRAGFVESIRGANGGYKLSREPKSIIVYEILQALDCGVVFKEAKTVNTLLSPFWSDVQTKTEEQLSMSLDELIEFLDKNGDNIIYYI